MNSNPKMKDLDEAKKCFDKHDIEEKYTKYKNDLEEIDIEYECNTCGKKIYLSYKLDGISLKEGA